jgi:ubiquinone/menaquinone biosynthesis C-methylase UbiE
MENMKNNELKRIKNKFKSINLNRYWGDDFDVRFYLISKFNEIKDKKILDVGGGTGIIASELDKSNFAINLDISLNDLRQCKKFYDRIEVINGSMTNISFKNNSFDYVICANLLEVAKLIDIENKTVIKKNIDEFPTVILVLEELKRILKSNGILFLTTPNNKYYESTKLTYDELKMHLEKSFKNINLEFYNTYPRLYSKNRKLNMANIIPKLLNKFYSREKIIQEKLVKKVNKNNKYSVSFFIKIINN